MFKRRIFLMSLVLDALKKAQDPQFIEWRDALFSGELDSPIEKGPTERKNYWIPASVGFGLFLLLFLGVNHLWPLFISHRRSQMDGREGKESYVSMEIKKEGLGLDYQEEPLIQQKQSPIPIHDSRAKAQSSALTPNQDSYTDEEIHISLAAERERFYPSVPILAEGKNEELPVESVVEEKGAIQVAPLLNPEAETGERPPPSDSSMEEAAYPESIETKQPVVKFPTSPVEVLTLFNEGIHFHQQKEILKAIQSYQKVLELDPNFAEAHNNLGIIHQEMGDWEKALEAYQKSVATKPWYERGHNNRGIILHFLGRNEEALEAFQEALALNPHNLESYLNMGILFKNQGQIEKAIESCQKALAINPFQGETHYNIGLFYEQTGNFDTAIRHYQKFIQLASPTHGELILKVQRHLNFLKAAQGQKIQEP